MKEKFVFVQAETLESILNRLDRLTEIIAESQQQDLLNDLIPEPVLAKHLGLTVATLANYRNEGKIGFVKADGTRKIFYKREHINEFVEKYNYKPFV